MTAGMSLSEYNKKRKFNHTPEPVGGKPSSDRLQFVVQQHDATRLHYDFRLELGGVLKSWAIPKGPSMNPQDKRLAMMVEDHPFDYKDFEGIIPEGNYGAGSVIVWDRGTYEPLEKSGSKKEQEKELLKELGSGSLKFRMFGEKLKGEFALVHIKNSRQQGENAWLLIKHKDEFATTADISRKSKSVLSGKTVIQVGKDKTAREWISNRKAGKKKTEKPDEPDPDPADIRELLGRGKKAPLPKKVKPMLATLLEKPFDGKDWLFEIKWDGYRAVGTAYKGRAGIESRHNISFDEKFLPVKHALEKWPVNAVVDGEIVALTADGMPGFQELQGFLKQEKAAELAYYVFDLLWYEGRDYTQLPLIERKAILRHILPASDEIIRFSDHVLEEGIAFFRAATGKGLEGIMAKKTDSVYTQHHRSSLWLKIKSSRYAEAIICGFTKGRNERKYFGAVILGRYEGKELKYMGHSGSGIDERQLKELYTKFQPLITNKCPFKVRPKTNMPATWLRPELVCTVKYSEVTKDGSLRHPIFAGLREDKRAADEKNVRVLKVPPGGKTGTTAKKRSGKTRAKVEKAKAPSMQQVKKKKIEPGKTAAMKRSPAYSQGTPKPAAGKKGAARNQPKYPRKKASSGDPDALLVDPAERQAEVMLNRHLVSLTHLNKLYWPKEKISKGDMINYYHRAAEYILPFLKDRPQSLNRYPNGINGEAFFQKNVGDQHPDWITTYRYLSESDQGYKYFLVARDEASLIYMANLGCIEMNPWNSRVQKPDNPDWCVIDLDPDKTNSFNQVIDAALQVKAYLDQLRVTAYCKTSGATGMHVYIPLGAKYSYEQSRLFAEMLVNAVHQELPGFTSVERSLAKRKGKIYLDFLQNRQIQTIAAPYSLRPKPGATVSMPLHWEEVKHGLKPTDFHIHNALDKIREDPDLFKGVLGPGIDLVKILGKLEKG
jgi:bifunctional non-homologous end joining protein LigD